MGTNCNKKSKKIFRKYKKLKYQMENISEHISYDEAIKSQVAKNYGMDNTPSSEQLENMRRVAEECFEPIRIFVGKKIYISSFYRCEKLNQLVGGVNNSNHLYGYAIDMAITIYGGKTNEEVFEWAKENIDFDELLWEGGYDGWIHIAYKSKEKNRHHVGTIPNPK